MCSAMGGRWSSAERYARLMKMLTRWQTIALVVAGLVLIVIAYNNGVFAAQSGAPRTPTTVSP